MIPGNFLNNSIPNVATKLEEYFSYFLCLIICDSVLKVYRNIKNNSQNNVELLLCFIFLKNTLYGINL